MVVAMDCDAPLTAFWIDTKADDAMKKTVVCATSKINSEHHEKFQFEINLLSIFLKFSSDSSTIFM